VSKAVKSRSDCECLGGFVLDQFRRPNAKLLVAFEQSKEEDIVEVELKYCWLKEDCRKGRSGGRSPPESFRAQRRPFGSVIPRRYLVIIFEYSLVSVDWMVGRGLVLCLAGRRRGKVWSTSDQTTFLQRSQAAHRKTTKCSRRKRLD